MYESIYRGLAVVAEGLEEIPFRLHVPRKGVTISISDPHVDWWFRHPETSDIEKGKPAYITFPASCKEKVDQVLRMVRGVLVELVSPDWRVVDESNGEDMAIVILRGRHTRVRGMFALECQIVPKYYV